MKELPPAVAALVIPKASLMEFMAIRKAQIPWIVALVRAAKDSTSLVSFLLLTTEGAIS
jgi:hypothetical protein